MSRENNDLLIGKVDHLRELMELRFQENTKEHEGTKNRLDHLNGEVAKNSQFRVQSKIWLSVFIALVTFLVPIAQLLVKEYLLTLFS